MKQKKATLKSVASILNVSTATISNAFNRPDQLSTTLRDKILSECERLGYSGPSVTARSLRTGKTGVIGVLLADSLAYNFSDPVASEFLAGLSQSFDEHNVNMLLLPSKSGNYQNTQVESIPDSFIVYGKPADTKVLDLIQRQQKPMVLVDFRMNQLPSINVNNYQASYEIAKHAIHSTQDHLLIFALKLSPNHSITLGDIDELYNCDEAVARCRYDGYMKAINESGISFEHNHVLQLQDVEPSILKHLIRGALTSAQSVDVLLCMSDRIAIAALEVAGELGISVPSDLRIVGFDGIPQAETLGITTVHQPIEHKGRLAAQMVLEERPYESLELETELIIRSTS